MHLIPRRTNERERGGRGTEAEALFRQSVGGKEKGKVERGKDRGPRPENEVTYGRRCREKGRKNEKGEG